MVVPLQIAGKNRRRHVWPYLPNSHTKGIHSLVLVTCFLEIPVPARVRRRSVLLSKVSSVIILLQDKSLLRAIYELDLAQSTLARRVKRGGQLTLEEMMVSETKAMDAGEMKKCKEMAGRKEESTAALACT